MAAEATSVVHPPWAQPKLGNTFTPLVLNNSLTGKKDPFVTTDPLQKQVKWYICGPTVYDSAHLGHARAYVTFDISRRILQRYFGFDVTYVMNITDIDDKIILRARQNFLFSRYCDELVKQGGKEAVKKVTSDLSDAASRLQQAVHEAVATLEAEVATAKPETLKDLTGRLEEAKLKHDKALGEISVAQEDVAKLSVKAFSAGAEKLAQVLCNVRGVLAPHIDRLQAHEAEDQSIFQAHARRYEQEFMEDMRSLGVQDPSAITRVSEYVPQVIKYVEKILQNGYGYEANGSVYFDTRTFNEDHDYAKLSPQSRGNLVALNDGEGALDGGGLGKRHPTDFALWKRSKSGEPRWKSPWGEGRPGWHIECSVMASDHFGSQVDIHSGGVDLKFPHHDNELAQAEAHYQNQQWVNYFLHAGHLYIKDCKMSKSLKNFVTIRAVLQRHTAAQIRFLFLLQPWDQLMNYDESILTEAAAKDRLFKEFFLNVRALVRRLESNTERSHLWTEEDGALRHALEEARAEVHKNLSDNLNFSACVRVLEGLVSNTNKYLASGAAPSTLLLRDVGKYVNDMLCVFGVGSEEQVGFGNQAEEQEESKVLRPVVDVLVSFRDKIAEAVNGGASPQDVLALCDELRDSVLPQQGVRLEDLKGQAAQWKLVDAQELLSELKAKRESEAREKAAKEAKAQKAKFQLLGKLLEGRLSVQQRFEKEGYKQFDDNGIPTHDPSGKELAKSAAKKLKKAAATRQKEHDKYLDAMKDPALAAELKSQEAAL